MFSLQLILIPYVHARFNSTDPILSFLFMNSPTRDPRNMVLLDDIKKAVTSPLNIMKKRSSRHVEEKSSINNTQKTNYPQQSLRRSNEPLLSLDDDNSDAPSEGETEFLNKMGEMEFLNSLECLKNDYGSYAPIMKDHLDSDQMKKITNKLAQRIVEVDDESGLSTEFSIDRHTCQTKVITNLTSKQETLLASTFVGKSDVLCDQSTTVNSLCLCGEDVVSSEGIEVVATQCDEGVELIPSAVGIVLNKSQADSPLSNELSPLPEPKKYGQYDPFGVKTDYSSGFIHEAPKLRRTRNFSFSNVNNLDKYEDIDLKRKLLSNLMEAQASGVFTESSDESSASIDYLIKWCGGTECVDGAIEVFDD